MSTHYDEALTALARMNAAADQLELLMAGLGNHILAQVTPLQPLANFSGTPEWVKLANARLLRDKHIEWGRKLYGVINGYAREMESGTKHLNKGRSVGFIKADVTVGTAEDYAKAIQHKHTVSPENSAVNDMIAKAANQLTGDSGEQPLATQRKIIDVMINDPTNWWPFDQTDLAHLDPQVDLNSGVIPLATLKARGAAQILARLSKYSQGKKGLDLATKNSLHNHLSVHGPMNLQRGGSGPRTTSLQTHTGQKVALLTIKMIYGQPRNFLDGQHLTRVGKIVFIAYQLNGALTVEYLQHS